MSGELARYGAASADLLEHPHLHREWAHSPDRALRRAVMRSPELTADVAEQLVATRRSGMHTLGSNPRTPHELLDHNPGARRRLQRVLESAPGGLDEVDRHPNRSRHVEVGSPTIDLVLALAERLHLGTARALAQRAAPPVDPLVLALLATRFGEPIHELIDTHASAERRRAVSGLLGRARALTESR